MPSYTMKDPDGVEHDIVCTISEMEQKKEEGWRMVFMPSKIVSIRDTWRRHTSDGWKDVLRNIRSNNPGSDLDI